MESTYIPGGYYVSKSQAAQILGLHPTTVQYHIDKGHLPSINMPDLGHHIREEDVLNFVANKPGKPSIVSNYPKVKR